VKVPPRPSARRTARRGFRAAGLGLVLLACAGCASGPKARTPEETLHEYARALREGDAERAYALLSQEARRTMPYDHFERMLRENPTEVREVAEALMRPTEPLEITAVISSPEGETLHLVYEDGAWKADVSAVDLYSQATPLAALSAFVRAFHAGRYDVLMRFVPVAKSDGLDAERLKQAWEGDQKEEMERLVEGLDSQLSTAKVEILGSRATVAYGAGGTVEMLLEDGAWKIEDF
jgi:hypothetical protein